MTLLHHAETSFDPFDPETTENLHAVLHHLRSVAPVVHSDQYGGFWVITQYEAARQVLQDWETFTSAKGVAIPRSEAAVNMVPIEVDPPVQQEWRRVLNPHMSPRALAPHEDAIRQIVDDLIDGFIEEGFADIAGQFAWQFPPMVVFQLLIGLPPGEIAHARRLAEGIVYQTGDVPESFRQFVAFIHGALVARQDQPPRGDVIDALLNGEIDGQRLGAAGAVPAVMLLVLGALDTTSTMTGNILRYLAEHPEVKDWLGSDAGRVGASLDELIRYFGPTTGLGRTATRDTEICGQKIAEGDRVMVCFSSANRDEQAFPGGEDLDLDRKVNRHMTFGLGVHRCVGSNLARLMSKVALEQVVVRLQDLRITDPDKIVYHPALVYGPHKLPVTFTPGPRLHPVPDGS
jgi:cytochrome P450